MKRVFLDANVLFTAAHNPHGKAAFVFELGRMGYFHLLTSDAACVEAERNLAAKYPDFLPLLLKWLRQMIIVKASPSAPVPPELPEKDALIFQAAVSGGATHFLTGDLRHFGSIMNQPRKSCLIVVQTVAEFLAALGA